MAAMADELNERDAQRLALTHLIKGCDDAVSTFLERLSEDGELSPVTTRAREILAELLASWRQALTTLERAAPAR
jgi:hypothetical protein